MDGALSIADFAVVCDEVVEVNTVILNQGETTITDVKIEVVVNGVVVDIINQSVNIPFQEQGEFIINIDDNLQQNNNNITLNLLEINNQVDEIRVTILILQPQI